MFWSSHDPYGPQGSTQYRSVLWTHGDEQAREAKAFVAKKAKDEGGAPTMALAKAPRFWIAEAYHQKYYLRGKQGLASALLGEGSSDDELLNSTLAARVNGWLAGHGTKDEIAAEVAGLALGEKAVEALASALGKRAPVLCR